MPAPKLIAIVTALILMSGQASFAEYSLAQLQEIERYVMTKNNDALMLLLQAHPELMAGEDPLAQELRSFMAANLQTGLLWFSAPTATLPPPDLELAQMERKRRDRGGNGHDIGRGKGHDGDGGNGHDDDGEIY